MKNEEIKGKIPVMTIQRFFSPGEHFHIQISTDFPDYVGILHRHEYIEVVYVISGTATHVIEDKTYKVKRGDLYIINVNTAHMFCDSKKNQEPLVVYDLMFTPEFFDKALTGSRTIEELDRSFMFRSLFQGRAGTDASFGVSGSLYTMFSELFNRIYHEYRNQDRGYMEIIRAYLLQVVITAIRMDEASANGSMAFNKKQAVKSVIDYIEEHFYTHISVQDLADKVFLNPDYLGRIFKEITGETISTRIQKVRIRHACQMLQSTQRTVTDIASACGFSDTKFFYSVFKKHMGVLPGDFRRNNEK